MTKMTTTQGMYSSFDWTNALQPEDISNAVIFALTAPLRSCPCEITGPCVVCLDVASHPALVRPSVTPGDYNYRQRSENNMAQSSTHTGPTEAFSKREHEKMEESVPVRETDDRHQVW